MPRLLFRLFPPLELCIYFLDKKKNEYRDFKRMNHRLTNFMIMKISAWQDIPSLVYLCQWAPLEWKNCSLVEIQNFSEPSFSDAKHSRHNFLKFNLKQISSGYPIFYISSKIRFLFTSTVSGNSSQNILSLRLKSKLCKAHCLFSQSVVLMLPSVGLFSIWNAKREFEQMAESDVWKSLSKYKGIRHNSYGLVFTMKLKRPVSIVETLHAGFHVSGWKSDMDRHSLVFTLNLPFGVVM